LVFLIESLRSLAERLYPDAQDDASAAANCKIVPRPAGKVRELGAVGLTTTDGA
jgi:hypothetical protein